MSNGAIFIYDDNNPGCITSQNGLDIGEHVVVVHNGQEVKLENIIRFGDNGYVSQIELNKSSSLFYKYCIDIVGAGPKSGSGYTYYTDETNDKYELSLYSTSEKSHCVRYNSKKPKITKITWEPIQDTGARFIYDDNNPGCITSESGLHPGEHVIVVHNGQEVKLEEIIRFGDTGYVSKIELNRSSNPIYDYCIDIIGAGPSKGTGYTYYTDETNDKYSLSLVDSSEKSHCVRYNSKKPKITKITWEPIQDAGARFIYDDNNPGCITSESGLHPGEHVVVVHNGHEAKLEDIIRFGDTGYVSKIELNRSSNPIYNYCIDIIGAGPSNCTGYTYYTDKTSDKYSLSLIDSSEKSHCVRYNSDDAIIKTISWDPVGQIIDDGIASRWMTDNPKIRALTLDKLTMLGSHDAGMCMTKFQFATIGATKNNTVTQVCTIRQQLNLGVRYFDLRPYYKDGEFYCGHFSNIAVVGWQGSCGESLSDIVKEINEFCKDKKELIILNFKGGSHLDISNYTPFTDNIWCKFSNKLNEINNIYQCNSNLLDETIDDLTKNKSTVIIITPTEGKFDKNTKLEIFDSYSNTEDYTKMQADQFNKLETFCDPNKLFLLSWTLTLSDPHNIDPSKSILKLADNANKHMNEIVDKVRITAKYPNIVYIDKIGDDAGFKITQEINELRKDFCMKRVLQQ